MKRIICLMGICMLLTTSCCYYGKTEQPVEEQQDTKGQQGMLNMETSLLNEKYEFFGKRGLGMPQAKQGYILAKAEDEEIEIRTAADFAQVVTGIASSEDALEFVRLFTSPAVHPFLSDVNYQEVHTQQEQEYGLVISQEQYADWNIAEPVVTEEDGIFHIERFVASYPKMRDDGMTPAQLLKIQELVDAQGHYTMEIQEVIAEGAEVQKILPFTK